MADDYYVALMDEFDKTAVETDELDEITITEEPSIEVAVAPTPS